MTTREKNYYASSSAKVHIVKAVVSGTGHVVGKNYSRDKLHEGDVGLELRIDRGNLTAMTPEQRTAAQTVGREMVKSFLGGLGVETTEPGFQPGMVVTAIDEHGNKVLGILERVTETSVLLRTPYVDGGRSHLRLCLLPLVQYVLVEEVGFIGIDGLVHYIFTVDEHQNLREVSFLSLASEELLAKLVGGLSAEQGSLFNAMVCRIHDEKILTEVLLHLLQRKAFAFTSDCGDLHPLSISASWIISTFNDAVKRITQKEQLQRILSAANSIPRLSWDTRNAITSAIKAASEAPSSAVAV